MRSYYQSARGISQYGSVMNRPIAGLNEYTPPTEITDNHLSDALDVLPYRDQAIEFQKTGLTMYFLETMNNIGIVRAVLPSYLADEDNLEIIAYVMTYRPSDGWYILKAVRTGSEDFIAVKVMTATVADGDVSACVFNTESERYYCFTNQVDDRLHFIRESNDSYGYVDLPFTPEHMVVHANRIFMLSENRLWWCRAGDLFSWYGQDYIEDAIGTTQAMQNGALTVTNQPDTGRLLTFKHVVNGGVDTVGQVAIVGMFNGAAQSETLLLIPEGLTISAKRYDEITSITQSGWTASDAADNIIIGVGPVGSKYVQGDAGYWTVEREQFLHAMCVLNDNIYLFGPHNIYVFQGYSYDTFSLQQIIADVGISKSNTDYGYGYSSIAVIKNTAFFKYNEDIYSFDGNSRPVIVSRPITTNGGSVNAVFGGINLTGTQWSLTADDEDLYLYKTNHFPAFHYRYNFQTKTWWKMSGISKRNFGTSDNMSVLFVTAFNRKSVFMFVSKLNVTTPTWLASFDHSVTQDGVHPYVITKAFNTNPSEDKTLTQILLHIKGTAKSTANIMVSCSVDDNGDEFSTVYHAVGYSFSGGSEIITIHMPVATIARQHHYRIKINIEAAEKVYLYNLERRYRVLGRSR